MQALPAGREDAILAPDILGDQGRLQRSVKKHENRLNPLLSLPLVIAVQIYSRIPLRQLRPTFSLFLDLFSYSAKSLHFPRAMDDVEKSLPFYMVLCAFT